MPAGTTTTMPGRRGERRERARQAQAAPGGDDRGPARLTRRRVVVGAATSGVAASLGARAEARQRPARARRRSATVDVAVVGAGLAGLTAAQAVHAAGRSVLVLEARARVGGRTLNHTLGGEEVAEVGGQFVGPTQDRVLALARELGVDTFKTYARGRNVFHAGGRRTTYLEGPLTLPPDPRFIPPDPAAIELAIAFAALDEMARQVSAARPWAGPRAAEWDAQTVESFKRVHLRSDAGRGIFDSSCQGLGFDPGEASLLSLAWFVAAAGDAGTAGSTARLFGTTGGAQESRFVGGSEQLSIRVARQLADAVVLREPVRRIEQSTTAVRVLTQRLTVRARRAVVAVPHALAARIDYDPELATQRRELIDRLPGNILFKCSAVYQRPFWREQGLTGMAAADRGALRVTFDNSPPDGRPGVLMGFIGGAEGRRWARRRAAERRAVVLDDLASFFGERARRPRDYFEQIWSAERWSRGSGTIWPPGVLVAHGSQLRVPSGRIHWAGAETASYWNGYMDGAVRSGERAAREVLAAL